MSAREGFVRALPKCEMHLHIEGTLEAEMMFALAERNGVRLPFADAAEVRRKLETFTDLQTFLDVYYAGAAALVTERDFYELTAAYIAKARADGCRHSDIFFDPQTHTDRNVDIAVVFAGIARAIRDASSPPASSTSSSTSTAAAAAADDAPPAWSGTMILCFLRHLSEDAANATLDAALPLRDAYRDVWVGVGLDSGERGNPPKKFSKVFARCRDAGLRVVAHAGEEGPAAYIEEALDDLKIERIDHGVRITEDPALVRRVAAAGTALTVCPLSNVRLRVFNTIADHNAMQLLAAGLRVTINSDDPAFFGGYLLQNYMALVDAFAIDTDTVAKLATNSVAAAFLPEDRRSLLLAEIDALLVAEKSRLAAAS